MSASETVTKSTDSSHGRCGSVPDGPAERRDFPLRHSRPGRAQRPLVGRSDECRLLDHLLEAVRANESRTLVIVGEPGVGKTTLVEYALGAAPDFRMARAVGAEAESELAFAALQQVCAPMLDRLDRLPDPQREALATALGLSAGSPPDRFLVGLAVLGLMSEAAANRPLLCIIDDAQWVDLASVQTLAFVARRVSADSVGILFATRHPSQELERLPSLCLDGLDKLAARKLLQSALSSPLDERLRERIIAETRGNPLALLELPRDLTPVQLAGGFGILGPQALTGRIEESFVRRLDTLSDATRRLLLVAAAEPIGDPLLLLRACGRLGISVAGANGESEELLELGERVTFRHPLVRAGVYRSAAVTERRAVHQALAEMTDRDVDPDRRAWHLAAAAAGPDENVALELECSAGRAQARGGVAASAAFLQRAVELTLDPARQVERALAAAAASFEAGNFDATQRLLATADSGPLDDFQRARATLLRGHTALASRYGNDAAPLLLDAAKQLEQFDVSLARRAYLTAWHAAVNAGHLGGQSILLEVCRAVRALPPLPPDPHPLDLTIEGFALLVADGPAAAMPILRRAAKEVLQLPVEDVVRWGVHVGGVRLAMWDDESVAVFERQARIVREAGALGELPIHLQAVALDRSWRGDLAGARRLIAEAESIATSTGNQVPPFALLRIRALEGREGEASPLIQAVIQEGTTQGQGHAVMVAYWAAAVLYNGLGRYEDAATASREVATNGIYPLLAMWALFELIEASARVGDTTVAWDALDELAATTQPAGSSFALGIEARCRALLADGDDAETAYREAIKQLDRAGIRTEQARAHLVFGEWLRRMNRRADARTQLRTAHEHFTSMGMEAFAERARRELLATGETARRRTVETRDDLTSQERQVAELARDGLSNPEIGARLFVSRRTVEWHLRHVFAKLEIQSRRELTSALGRLGLRNGFDVRRANSA